MEIRKVVRFSGNAVPTFMSEELSENTLVWPESPSYPGLDCMVWERKPKVWYLIQITIADTHDMNFTDAMVKELLNNTVTSTPGVGLHGITAFLVWIGLNEHLKSQPSVKVPYVAGQHFLSLKDFGFLQGCGIKGLE